MSGTSRSELEGFCSTFQNCPHRQPEAGATPDCGLLITRKELAHVSRALAATGQGVVLLDREQKTQWRNELAVELFGAFFPALACASSSLPEALRLKLKELSSQEFSTSEKPPGRQFSITQGARRLRVSWVARSPEESCLLLVEETPPPAKVDGISLSRRELEVLQFISQGKSNPEIGIILGVSQHTVRKHVQNLLSKLGVESRTAAARYVWDHQLSR